jgi:hypothetical protein
MAPILDAVAPKVSGQLSIGKIDCTLDQKFCSEFQVRGYPTLKFSIDGELHDYQGGRGESDIIGFSKKINSPEVKLVQSINEAQEYTAKDADDGVAFVAYHPELKGNKLDEKLASTLVTQVYAQVARHLKVSGHFLLLDNAALDNESFESSLVALGQKKERPFICRIEHHVAPRCFDKDLGNINKSTLLEYALLENVATVSHFGPSNFNKIGRKGRPLVIAVVTSADADDEVAQVKKILAEYATTGPEKIRDKYYYGWFDGKMWGKFLQQFEIVPANLPQVFVLDFPRKRYWQNPSYKLNIKDLLQDIESGIITVETAGKKGFDGYVERGIDTFMEYMPWSAMLVALVFAIIIIGIINCVTPGEDLRPPYTTPPPSMPSKSTPSVPLPGDETKKEK